MMGFPPGTKWFWADDCLSEEWDGPFDSEDKAKEGRDGGVVCPGNKHSPGVIARACIDVDYLLEMMEDKAQDYGLAAPGDETYSIYGDSSEDGSRSRDKAEQALDIALENWAETHLEVTYYQVDTSTVIEVKKEIEVEKDIGVSEENTVDGRIPGCLVPLIEAIYRNPDIGRWIDYRHQTDELMNRFFDVLTHIDLSTDPFSMSRLLGIETPVSVPGDDNTCAKCSAILSSYGCPSCGEV